jgi:hypothetical protein
MDLRELRLAIRDCNIEWQKHCLQRMLEREVTRQEVMDVILKGEKIESYPTDWPLPSALFYYLETSAQRPLHVIVAFNSVLKKAFIITAYEPDLAHFESDFKTRRKR